MDIKYTTPIKVEIYGNGGSPEKETPTPKTVEEVVAAFGELKALSFEDGSIKTNIKKCQDWLRTTLTNRDAEWHKTIEGINKQVASRLAENDERLREAVKEILNNQKRIMAVATKDISPQAAEGAIVFVDIVPVYDIKQIATKHGITNL